MSSQVKSSQVKSSQVKILAAVWGLALLSGAAQAQVTTTETLNFDNNLLPGGWSLYGGHGNVKVINQRVEMGQVDNYGGVAKAVDLSAATQVRIEYDSNISDVYWGQGSTAVLVDDMAKFVTNGLGMTWATAGMQKSGYGESSMRFQSTHLLSGTNNLIFSNVVNPPIFGNYHMNAVFENGSISQIVTNLDTGVTFASGLMTVPGFLLSSMNYVALHGWTTTGASAWIDNASISITTAVPEPESYALLLAGLGVLGAVRRRQSPPAARA